MQGGLSAPFSGKHLAEFCLKMAGQPYWYGTCLYRATRELLKQKRGQYPREYALARTPRYERDIAAKAVCADCIGAIKGYMWTNGGKGVLESIGTGKPYAIHYAQNNCPDLTADGMFAYAKAQGAKWGDIAAMPEAPGIALCKPGHTAVYAGGGECVEWRSFATGCVKTRLSERDLEHWYYLPFISYGQ